MVNSADTPRFEHASTPLARRLQDSLPRAWEEIRDSHIKPLHASTLSDSEAGREETLAGFELLGLLSDDQTVHPQQLMVSDVINAGTETVVIEEPRRSSKTTSILAVLLGRCISRTRYKVVFSAQSGTKSSEFFREWVSEMELAQGFTPESSWPFKPRFQAGSMMLTFRNGSTFKVLNTPSAKALRGGAADVVWFDESQEFDADQSADLKSGALPLMDTRDGAQLILSGTAGDARSGWFWDALESGRKGAPGYGILEYAAPPSTTYDQINDEAVWLAAHPGIGTLTTLEKMRSRREAFSDPEWAAEYLGLWPEDFTASLFGSPAWSAAVLPAQSAFPTDVAFGYDVSFNGSTAAIVAAWRDADGTAYLDLVDHRPGSSWVKGRIVELAKRYKAQVGYNAIGGVLAVAEEIQRARSIPKTRMTGVKFAQIAPSCSTLYREFDDGKLHHFDQPGMTDAFLQVGRQQMGDKAWKWVPGMAGSDITPVWAATMALRAFDERPKTARLKAIVA